MVGGRSVGQYVAASYNNPANPGQGVIPEGNAYIVEPLGDGQYSYLARLGPEDWARLADLSQSR